MQVAEILSDLTSLQVCDANAALALVSTRPDSSTQATSEANVDSSRDSGNDPDLQRAKDLLNLHAKVQLVHRDGTDRELEAAREAVNDILRKLK